VHFQIASYRHLPKKNWKLPSQQLTQPINTIPNLNYRVFHFCHNIIQFNLSSSILVCRSRTTNQFQVFLLYSLLLCHISNTFLNLTIISNLPYFCFLFVMEFSFTCFRTMSLFLLLIFQLHFL
jgi:hypothetical protein